MWTRMTLVILGQLALLNPVHQLPQQLAIRLTIQRRQHLPIKVASLRKLQEPARQRRATTRTDACPRLGLLRALFDHVATDRARFTFNR
jgi:hypothetical protein